MPGLTRSTSPVSEGPTPGLGVILSPLGQRGQSYRCVMIGIGHGSLLLESPKRIEPSTEAVLKFDRITLNGTVRYCNARSGYYRVSVAVSDNETTEGRTAPRFPMDEPGTLIALGDRGSAFYPCRLTDFSRSGLGLKASSEVPVGTMICIETRSIMVAGSVRRSTPNSDGSFQIGVVVTDVLSNRGTDRAPLWSVEGFRLRLAEFILGRPIETPRTALSASRRR